MISIGLFDFSFGIAPVIVAIVIPSIYILIRLLRHGDAWLHRKQHPQERLIAKIVLGSIIGFIAGSAVQRWVDQITSCRQLGYEVRSCVGRVFFPAFYEQQTPTPSSITPAPHPQTGGSNKRR